MAENSMMGQILASLKPYQESHTTYSQLPKNGRPKEQILEEMKSFFVEEEDPWREGYASGAVYHGDPKHIDFQNQAYALNSQSNPLHFDLWPSATKFESEIVSMTAHILGASASKENIVGSVTSGGTESILTAMKTYRDWARATKGITHPEMILPSTAHAAFHKAAHFFGIKKVVVPVGPDYRADVEATRNAINENSIVLVGSAPPYPHGIIDSIQELSELAQEQGIGFHTDGCLGGFLLPWAERLGYDVPPFDFRLPGVTSISVDPHKYGYSQKGCSVILYRGEELRHHQYFVMSDWQGGLYISPSFAGSRSGGLIAQAWATMLSLGEEGYLKTAARILETAVLIKKGILQIPELDLLGDPLFVLAFTSNIDDINIYAVSSYMTKKGWNLSGLQMPPAIHLHLTLRHTQPGVAERLIVDLQDAVAYARENPAQVGTMGMVYGMTGNVEMRGAVEQFLHQMLDMIYTV